MSTEARRTARFTRAQHGAGTAGHEEYIYRACRSKRVWKRRVLAETEARRQLAAGKAEALWTYRCPVCRMFHLTSAYIPRNEIRPVVRRGA